MSKKSAKEREIEYRLALFKGLNARLQQLVSAKRAGIKVADKHFDNTIKLQERALKEVCKSMGIDFKAAV